MSIKKATKLLHKIITSNNKLYLNIQCRDVLSSKSNINISDFIKSTTYINNNNNNNHHNHHSESLQYSNYIILGLLGFTTTASLSKCEFKSNNNNNKPEFIPRDKFKGNEKGYVYRDGDKGLGYYQIKDYTEKGQIRKEDGTNEHKQRIALLNAQHSISNIWKKVEKETHNMGINLHMSAPRVMLVDNKLSVRFPVKKGADMTAVIVDIVDRLEHGKSSEYAVKGGSINLKVAECGVARVLQFDPLPNNTNEKKKDVNDGFGQVSDNCPNGIFIQIFIPTFGADPSEVEILKPGSFTESDLSLIESALRLSNTVKSQDPLPLIQKNPDPRKHNFRVEKRIESFDLDEDWEKTVRKFMEESFKDFREQQRKFFDIEDDDELKRYRGGGESPEETPIYKEKIEDKKEDEKNLNEIVKKLESMGAIVYMPNPTKNIDWGILSGYEEQKRRIEDGLLLPLLHPEVFDSIAKKTRKHFVTNRPRGVLFDGPPGTGKTTSARIVASQVAVPLVYIPLESIMSRWYGESEHLLADAFKFANELGGSIIFFDEIETLAIQRGTEMHEATRRVLGVLLREMEGFDTRKKIVVIGATNRKQDLDPALLSRFDASVKFELPDKNCRKQIIEQYAQHLSKEDVAVLSERTLGMSGRDLRDICESAERVWASRIIRGEIDSGALPKLPEYIEAIKTRRASLA